MLSNCDGWIRAINRDRPSSAASFLWDEHERERERGEREREIVKSE